MHTLHRARSFGSQLCDECLNGRLFASLMGGHGGSITTQGART